METYMTRKEEGGSQYPHRNQTIEIDKVQLGDRNKIYAFFPIRSIVLLFISLNAFWSTAEMFNIVYNILIAFRWRSNEWVILMNDVSEIHISERNSRFHSRWMRCVVVQLSSTIVSSRFIVDRCIHIYANSCSRVTSWDGPQNIHSTCV